MKLKDITTIQKVSLDYGIPVSTLVTRLTLKSLKLIEGDDYKRMGKGQSVLISPEGVKKLIKKSFVD